MAHLALSGENPFPIVNLTKTNRDGTPTVNPYQYRFENCWCEEIDKSTALSQGRQTLTPQTSHEVPNFCDQKA